nr:MAG: tRNA pseudouridine(55) synthase TruB [Pseudomonadota bacterium]
MSGGARMPRRRLDGVLLLDKPKGLTSNAALQQARRLYAAEKAGHTGTLDPMATGLLPVLFGEATKFGGELLDSDKRYLADIRLGVRTNTGDAEGEVLAVAPVQVTAEALEQAVRRYTGRIRQVPPMYSALKHAGRPLYDYARAGETVEREAREVTIHRLDILRFEGERLQVDVHCSKGTYVRTLAEDLGEALGCGAHLAGLRRTAVGPFRVEDAIDLETLERLSPEQRDARLEPVDVLVQHLPEVVLDGAAARRFANGQAVPVGGRAEGRRRVYAAGRFLGVAELEAGVLRPRRLLRTDAPAAA